jgi:pimeloyl-ACP methyl ester carboxylesterase
MNAINLVLQTTVAGLSLVGLGSFVCWRRRLLARLSCGSEIRETARGPIEFAVIGTGPVLLHLHGGASGCDQTLALSWDLHLEGFTVLTPSRPGYLRTPLAAGAAPEQAADAMAGLLDALGIGPVCVVGTSGGGPTALQFALRHPERVWGLVLQSAITRRFIEPRRSTRSLIGRLIFSRSWDWLADFGAWCVYLLVRCRPALVIRQLLVASDALEPAKAGQRLSFVLRHPEQVDFFRRVIASGVPLSVRRTGLHNDLQQFAQLPVYPLEQINCPTLVLHGGADGNVPLAHAEFVANTVRGAELFALPDCGHFIWVGPGAESARARIGAFLRRQAPAAQPHLDSRERKLPRAEPDVPANGSQPIRPETKENAANPRSNQHPTKRPPS